MNKLSYLFGLKWLKRQAPETTNLPTGRHIDFTKKTWGHSIEFLSVKNGMHEVTGWCRARVEPGDVILHRFESTTGLYPYTAALRVIEVRYPGDPPDMFFATLANEGHWEGGTEPKVSSVYG